MKRFNINFILTVVFIFIFAVILLSLVAEIEFNKAKKLEESYLWKKAGKKHQMAVRLNPFKADYFLEAGNFFLKQSAYRKDKTSWHKRAKRLYERAAQLNPHYAECWYLLGKAELNLGKNEVAIDNFKKAFELDRYNFRNNYLIGHNLLTIWDSLDKEEKDFALERLKYVLRLKSDYCNYVYPEILYYTKDFTLAQQVTPKTLAAHEDLYWFIKGNNLWQYHKEQKKLLDLYMQKERPEEFNQEMAEKLERIKKFKEGINYKFPISYSIKRENWQGKTEEGETFKNGNMYWEGTVNTVINVPEGETIVKIQAKGSQAYDIWPYMIVELDGEEIGETFIDSADWQDYSFSVNTDGGIKVLSITFVNDGGNWKEGIDRNLYVGEARAETYEK